MLRQNSAERSRNKTKQKKLFFSLRIVLIEQETSLNMTPRIVKYSSKLLNKNKVFPIFHTVYFLFISVEMYSIQSTTKGMLPYLTHLHSIQKLQEI